MSQTPEANPRDFETIAIVGVGLIGGSIALAAKARGVVRTVLGVGRNPCAAPGVPTGRGVIDEGLADLAVRCPSPI